MSIPSARRLAAPILAASVGGGALCDDALDDRALEAAARRVSAAQRVVAFTGAGVSAESGIRTYRDAVAGAGLWDGLAGQLGMLLFATPIGWLTLPTLAWRHYCERLLVPIHRAEPNAAHRALAELDALLGDRGGLPVITQNVDALHQRAGSRVVHELHGSVATHRHAWTGAPVALAPGAPPDPAAPPCWFARPDVVLFFESLGPAFWRAATLVDELGPRDVLLVVGTSCAVAPAGTLPYAALSRGCAVFEVNPERCLLGDVPLDEGDGGRPVMTYGAHAFDQTLLRGKAGEVLPALVARVRALRDTGRE